MEKKTTVALYARVSTRDKGQDYENQLIDLREFVQRKYSEGWELGEVYVDKVSGKTAEKRPQFCRMLADASEKRFDLVSLLSKTGTNLTTRVANGGFACPELEF
jgi:DNA invertase Pin-like site-specific DNA recombinase